MSLVNEEFLAEGSEAVRELASADDITGEKGKGGKAREAVEADNTLRSAAIFKVIEVLSEGPIEGLCGGAQGIYIDNTPLQNSDGSYNFPRVNWDFRVGLPDQDHMPGFSSSSAEIGVNAPVLFATPVVRSVTANNIDAVRVTVQLPFGLKSQNLKNGDLNGYNVSFRVDTKPTSSGTWQAFQTYTIKGKTTSPYEVDYRIERPAGSGTWDIRVVRTSADETSSAKVNNMTWSRLTEIIDAKLQYNDTALVGIGIDAESVGLSIPTRAYMVKGKIITVPANYDATNKTYSGIWNGLFKQSWTDNPAWVLYDLMTNTRYGMGDYITSADIDLYAFYDAGVYCDGMVPDGEGGTEPRFTFSAAIVTQEDAAKLLTLVAGSFRSKLVQINGKWTLLQDRPSSPVRNITNSNVQDGLFTYKSTGLFERHTAFNVAWNNQSDRYLQKVTTVEDADGIARYGYFPTDIASYGATREGQAIRTGKWALDTEQNQTELTAFTMSLNGFDLLPNEIFNLYDEFYTGLAGSGRVASVSGVTVNLDKQIILVPGSTISIQLADGKTVESRGIVQTSGSLSTITLVSAFSQSVLDQADYAITTSLAARQFKVMNLTFPEDGKVNVEALFHEPGKYARVELGVAIPPEIYTVSQINNSVVKPPTGLVITQIAIRNPDTSITRSLELSWTKATIGAAANAYFVNYNRSGDNETSLSTSQTAISIPVPADGTYNFFIYAKNSIGQVSGEALIGSVVVSSDDAGVLGAVQAFYIKGTTSRTWHTDDLTINWIKNLSDSDATQDYQVTIKTLGSKVLYQEIVAATEYTYTLQKNRADAAPFNLPPQPILEITVTPRDMFGRLCLSTTYVFDNPAPVAPVISLDIGINNISVNLSLPLQTDYKGSRIWMSLTSPVANDPEHLIYDGPSTSFVKQGLLPGVTYYFSASQYDGFKDSTLNYTATTSAIPLFPGNVPVSDAIPTNVYLGDVVYSELDSNLYQWVAEGTPGYVQVTPLIAANRIVAAKLDAISLDAGQIRSGNFTLDATSYLRMGATSYADGAGLWTGYDVDSLSYAFRIGDPSTTILDYNGATELQIRSASAEQRLSITSGNVVSEKKIGDTWYEQKGLTRIEQGVGANNAIVQLPGYFNSPPSIMVSPAALQTYASASSTADQTLNTEASNLENILHLNVVNLSTFAVLQGLEFSNSGTGVAWRSAKSYFKLTAEKAYWEIRVNALSTDVTRRIRIGLSDDLSFNPSSYAGSAANSFGYDATALKVNNASTAAYGATYTLNDTIGVAYDGVAHSVTFYKNGVSQGVAFTGLPSEVVAVMSVFDGAKITANFGETPLTYTAPAGYITCADLQGFKQTYVFRPYARLILAAGANFAYVNETVAGGASSTNFSANKSTAPNTASITLAGVIGWWWTTAYVAVTVYVAPTEAKKRRAPVTVAVEVLIGGVWTNRATIYSRAATMSSNSWAGTFTFPSAGTWTWRLVYIVGSEIIENAPSNTAAASYKQVVMESKTEYLAAASTLAAGTLNWIAIGQD